VYAHQFATLQGAYRDDNGQPVVLDCVREAERKIAGSGFME
jgi:aspartate aminotransferase